MAKKKADQRRGRGRKARRQTGSELETAARLERQLSRLTRALDARGTDAYDKDVAAAHVPWRVATAERHAAEWKELEQGKTWYRLRRHTIPHQIAWWLLISACLFWLVDRWAPPTGWLAAGRWTAVLAVATGIVTTGTATGLAWRLRRARWGRRASVAAVVAAAWLTSAVALGPSWGILAALLAADLAVAAGYWRAIRIRGGAPKREADPAEAPRPPVVESWARYIGCDGGVAPKSRLTGRVVTDTYERYAIELLPGKQSLNTLTAVLDKIASGLRTPIEKLIVEAHESRDPARAQLTIVTRSPIKDTVLFTEPRYFHDGPDGWIEPGWYADGTDRVRVPLYAEHSARNLTLIGGQGSGKTALLDQLALSAMASGHTCVWYLDGQDGTSSPQLRAHADWAPTGPEREETILDALETTYAIRGKVLQAQRLPGLTPSPDLPGLIVIVDECHEFFDPNSPRLNQWVALARMGRKLGVSFWAATQHPSLGSFGNDVLRSLLMQTTAIVLRVKGGVAKNILRLAVDPEALPTLPGYGYVIGGSEDVRTAPWRADYLPTEQADTWFEQYPSRPLERISAKAIGEDYLERVEIAEAERAALLENLAALDDDDGADVFDLLSRLDPTITQGRRSNEPKTPRIDSTAWPVTQFPAAPDLRVINGGLNEAATRVTARDAVYQLIAAGVGQTGELISRSSYARSHVHRALDELVGAGRVVKAGHGTYTLPGTDQTGNKDSEAEEDEPAER